MVGMTEQDNNVSNPLLQNFLSISYKPTIKITYLYAIRQKNIFIISQLIFLLLSKYNTIENSIEEESFKGNQKKMFKYPKKFSHKNHTMHPKKETAQLTSYKSHTC